MSNIRSFDRSDHEPAKGLDRAAPDGTPSAKPSDDQARGRRAAVPWQIPLKGWKDILIRTYQQINDHRLLAVAAGVVFYGLLALFPAISALVSSYALFAKASTINDHVAMLSGVLPQGAFDIVRDQIGRVLAKGDVKLGLTFFISLLFAIWSANG